MVRGGVTTNFGGVDVVPHCSDIVVCYGGGRVTANFGGVRGAIAGCHCSVLEGDDQLLGSGLVAIAGCHCSVLEGDDQLLGSGHGAIAGPRTLGETRCHCRVPL